MDIQKIIKERRALYTQQFSGKAVPESVIKNMLELANWAPTHKHTEPWRFKVYEGEALNRTLDQIAELYVKQTDGAHFNPAKVNQWQNRKKQVSHLIAIVMKRHEHSGIPEMEEIASVAMAVQNMWLYLSTVPNTGGYWSTPAMVFSPEFAQYLKLEGDEQCLGIFLVGHIKEDASIPDGKRGHWEEKVDWYKI